jgi:hypothetical protein
MGVCGRECLAVGTTLCLATLGRRFLARYISPENSDLVLFGLHGCEHMEERKTEDIVVMAG